MGNVACSVFWETGSMQWKPPSMLEAGYRGPRPRRLKPNYGDQITKIMHLEAVYLNHTVRNNRKESDRLTHFSAGKEICPQCGRPEFDSWIGKIPWRRDRLPIQVFLGFPGGSDGKESACNAGDLQDIWVQFLGEKIPWRRIWQLTPVFLPGESP